MPVRRFRSLPLAGIFLGAVVFGFGALAASPSGARATGGAASAPSVVEEVRYTASGNQFVEHRILIDTTVVADPAAMADEVAGPNVVHSGEVTAQYAINAWKWLESAMPIEVSYNPSLGAPRPGLTGPIENAIDQWSSVTPATFQFAYAGTTSAHTGACDGDGVPDGINTISYVTTLPAGTLGQTCTLTVMDGDTGHATLFEFDMELNWSIDWGGQVTQPAQYDIYSTVLHEMGHAAGLAHPCILGATACTAADQASVMYASLKLGVDKRSLTQDDMNALRAQYPGGPSPLPDIPPFDRLFDVAVAGVSRE